MNICLRLQSICVLASMFIGGGRVYASLSAFTHNCSLVFDSVYEVGGHFEGHKEISRPIVTLHFVDS